MVPRVCRLQRCCTRSGRRRRRPRADLRSIWILLPLPLQTAEVLYKKRQKKEAPRGWESFNQHTLFRGFEKRTDKIEVDMEVRPPLLGSCTPHLLVSSCAGSTLALHSALCLAQRTSALPGVLRSSLNRASSACQFTSPHRTCAWAPGLQEYEAKKAADPEFYRSADTMSYGRAAKDSDASIDRMVAELADRCGLLAQRC